MEGRPEILKHAFRGRKEDLVTARHLFDGSFSVGRNCLVSVSPWKVSVSYTYIISLNHNQIIDIINSLSTVKSESAVFWDDRKIDASQSEKSQTTKYLTNI